jgi:hypothetical protein
MFFRSGLGADEYIFILDNGSDSMLLEMVQRIKFYEIVSASFLMASMFAPKRVSSYRDYDMRK